MLEWQRWTHRVVRDLAWAIASPPLVTGRFGGVIWWDESFVLAEYKACLPTLEKLDKDPTPLLDYLDRQNVKALGHRFEALVGYWLEISPNIELLHQSVQLHGEGRTLGELDFILRDKHSQQVIHLEVAVKFYMGLAPLQDSTRWYGSNLKDSFSKKINHLKTQQTQLSLQHPKLLPIPIDQRCCCVKGRLFYPENTATDVTPQGISENHLRGVWGTDARQYAETLGAKPIPIAKPQWFAQFDGADIELFTEHPIPVMKDAPQCFVLVSEGGELGRYFQYPVGYFKGV